MCARLRWLGKALNYTVLEVRSGDKVTEVLEVVKFLILALHARPLFDVHTLGLRSVRGILEFFFGRLL